MDIDAGDEFMVKVFNFVIYSLTIYP